MASVDLGVTVALDPERRLGRILYAIPHALFPCY